LVESWFMSVILVQKSTNNKKVVEL
jgi:hypothetical protein